MAQQDSHDWSAGVRQRWGLLSTRIGLAGMGVLLLAFILTGISGANGVHCPACDRIHLSDAELSFWQSYFFAKDMVYAAATLLLAAAIPLASPRRWPFVFALLLALFALSLTPA